MKPTLKRLAALAAFGTMGIAVPVANASAATSPAFGAGFPYPLAQFPVSGLSGPGIGLPGPGIGLPAFTPAPLTFVGPSLGQVAAVIGPTIITTAPSTFNNTNIQVSAGSNGTGGQVGP
jgi:hypothetical protein